MKSNKGFKYKLKKIFYSKNKAFISNTKILPGNAQFIGSRDEQQDAFGFSDIDDMELVKNVGVLAVLADGMGGFDKGKDASNIAVKIMIDTFAQNSTNEPISELLNRMLYLTNSYLLKYANDCGLNGRIGTTLTAAVIKNGSLYWISVGDSRLYHYRNGVLMQMTEDHNYANELEKDIKSGNITKEEAVNKNGKDHLTSYLGIEDIKYIDFNLEPFNLEPKDLIILCSDGLYKTLKHEEIIEVLNKNNKNPQKAAEALIKRVKDYEKPYQDNTTVVILGYNLN